MRNIKAGVVSLCATLMLGVTATSWGQTACPTEKIAPKTATPHNGLPPSKDAPRPDAVCGSFQDEYNGTQLLNGAYYPLYVYFAHAAAGGPAGGKNVVELACQYWKKCASQRSPVPNCREYLKEIQDVIHRPLTPSEIRQIVECTGCDCGGDPNTEDPCPINGPPTCGALIELINGRLACEYLRTPTESAPRKTDPEVIAKAVCDFYNNCMGGASGSGGPTGFGACSGATPGGISDVCCDGQDACLAMLACLDNNLPGGLTPDIYCKIKQCMGENNCLNDLGNAVGAGAGNPSLTASFCTPKSDDCSKQGNPPVAPTASTKCENLGFLLKIQEGEWKCESTPPSDAQKKQRKAKLVCAFMAACSSGLTCEEVLSLLDCLLNQASLTLDDICELQSATCSPIASTAACAGYLNPTGTDRCLSIGQLRVLLKLAKCADPLSETSADDMADILCKLIGDGCSEKIDCNALTSLIDGIFPPETGKSYSTRANEIITALKGKGCLKCKTGTELREVDGLDAPCPPSSPETTNPVLMAFGDKVERTTDLSIPVVGGSFSITRFYDSNPRLNAVTDGGGTRVEPSPYARTALVGWNWSMSIFQTAIQNTDRDVHVSSAFGDAERIFAATTDRTRWVPTGATGEDIVRTSVLIDGIRWSVLRLRKPGNGFTDFIDGYEGPQAPELIGRILQDQDDYGNANLYFYAPILMGASPAHSASNMKYRLVTILVNCKATTPEEVTSVAPAARLELAWSAPITYPNSGSLANDFWDRVGPFLTKIEVFRLIDRSPRVATWIPVERMEYRQLTDDTGAAPSHLGLPGDLVEVRHSRLLNLRADGEDFGHSMSGSTHGPIEMWKWFGDQHMQATHYRYYTTDQLASAATIGSGAYLGGNPSSGAYARYGGLFGWAHQLKMIIQPEQVEYLAATLAADPTSGVTLVNRLVLGARAQSDQIDAALDALWAADDVTTMALGSSGSVAPVDLAAKVIGYEDHHTASGTPATTTAMGRVLRQFVQTSCGCSGSSHGTQLDYSYVSYTTVSGVSSATSGFSITETESVITLPDGVTTSAATVNGFTPYRKMIHDIAFLPTNGGKSAPYVINDVLQELVTATSGSVAAPASSSRTWVSHREYTSSGSTHTLAKEFSASAASTSAPYTTASSGTSFTYTANGSAGLVTQYTYDAAHPHQVAQVFVGQGSSMAGKSLQVEYTYGHSTLWWMPTQVDRIREYNESTSAAHANAASPSSVETVTYTVGLHTGAFPHAVNWLGVYFEREEVGENGSGALLTTPSFSVTDQCGRPSITISPDGRISVSEYSSTDPFGLPSSRTFNPTSSSSPSIPSLPSGVTLPSPSPTPESVSATLTSTTEQDATGRTVSTTTPRGVKHYSLQWLSKVPEDVWTITGGVSADRQWYRGVIRAPYHWTESSTDKYDGLTSVDVSNAAAKSLRTSEFVVEKATGSYSPLEGLLKFDRSSSPERSRSISVLHPTGVTDRVRRYSHVPTGGALFRDNVASEEKFEYDSLGRLFTHFQPANSGDPQTVRQSYYDVQGRVTTVLVGRALTGSTLLPQKVAEYIYDDASGAPGMGNGNVTMIKAYSDSSTSRSAKVYYDDRDRVVARENPAPPHPVTSYDNLDRPLTQSVYTTFSGYPTIAASNRVRFSDVSYSQRGLRYRERVAVTPTDTTPTNFLETHRWFDDSGRPVEVWGPNGPAVKMKYDVLGRAVVRSITDRDGDLAPGTSSNFASAITLNEDNVLEETRTDFDDYGNVKLVTNAYRSHDAAETGSGSGSLLADSNTVKTFVAYGYDPADRLIRMVNFGTNIGTDISVGTSTHAINLGTDVFAKGGTAPVGWDSTSTTLPEWNTGTDPITTFNWDNTIIEAMTYDDRGRLETNVDPLGRKTKYFYDDASRRVAVAENFHNADVQWGSGGRWTVTGVTTFPDPTSPFGSTTMDDRDRVTSTILDGAGRQVKRIAHLAKSGGEDVEITEYVYGSTNAPTTDSDIASADLLHEVKYPNTLSGTPPTSTDIVSYRYNRLGELKQLTDQNGTVHDYTRDALGRVTFDVVSAFGSIGGYSVDSAVQAIGVEFDLAGRMEKVKSYSDTSPPTTIVNEANFAYTPLWQIDTLLQNPLGAVGVSSPEERPLTYTYATVPFATSGLTNYSRVSSTVQPSGANLDMSYGDLFATGVDNRIHRQTGIIHNTENFGAKYAFLGLSIPAVVDYAEADVQLDRTIDRTGHRRAAGFTSQTDGVYPGLDRFGRLKRQVWVYGDVQETTNAARRMTRPALVELEYSYDRASNRTEKNDITQQYTTNINRSEKYVYDGLNRLRESQTGRGTMPPVSQNPQPAVTFAPINGSTNWVLDQTGNWLATRKDLAGATPPPTPPVYADTGDTKDARTHNTTNATNQIDDSTITTVGSSSPPPTPFGYDRSGNLITKGPATGSNADVKYTYDAWNRLVKVEMYDVGSTAYKAVNEFGYNGLHWRVRVKESSVLNVRPGDLTNLAGLDRDRLIYFDPGWRAVTEAVSQGTPNGYLEETADTLWGLTYIDEAIVSRRTGSGNGIDKADPLYHLYDAQFSVVGRMVDDGGILPRMVERIVYSVYGEPTVYPYSYADCADTSGNEGPDGILSSDDQTKFNAWYGATPKDVRADISDINSVVPMVLADNVTGAGNNYVTADDATAFANEYGANTGTITPVAGFVSLPPMGWSGGGGLTFNGASDTPVSDIGYCGYAWNNGSAQYAVRFRNYDPGLGRWLQRDPAGYVDGMSNVAYQRTRPTTSGDPTGLYGPDGHYWSVFIAARCALGDSDAAMKQALTLAYYAQYPDQVERYDAFSIWQKWFGGRPVNSLFQEEGNIQDESALDIDIYEWVHSLHCGQPETVKRRKDCLRGMIKSNQLTGWEKGFVIHAFGDSYSHVDANGKAFCWPEGHGAESVQSELGSRSCPDCIGNNQGTYASYMMNLCAAIAGPRSTMRCIGCMGEITAFSSDLELASTDGLANAMKTYQLRLKALALGFPRKGFIPNSSHNTSSKYPDVSEGELKALIKKMKECCNRRG